MIWKWIATQIKNITFLTSFIGYWIIFECKSYKHVFWSYIIDLSFLSFFIWNHFFSFFLSKTLAYYSRWHQFKIVVFFSPYSFLGTPILLRFSKTHELWSSKAAFTIGCFSLPSIIIIGSQATNLETQTHKTDRNHPITNHKPWPFESVEVNFCS